MTHWKIRAEMLGDVVFFPYAKGINNDQSEVFVWDLDKTYLDTSWQTPGELMRTVFEKSFQKKNIPGTSTLVTSVKDNWLNHHMGETFPLYFITASPPQMEVNIREKLDMDSLLPLGIFFKDNMRNLRPSRWRRLTQQVGFKLQALMQLRVKFRGEITQVLWGDDSETDATIYSLYSDLCVRRWTESELVKVLKSFSVTKEQIDTILDLQDQCPVQDPVEKIYINLAVDTDPDYYLKFGRRVVATANSFQASLDLFQDSRLQEHHVVQVAEDLVGNYGYTRDELQSSFDDLIRRRILAQETFERILPVLQEHGIVTGDFKPSVPPGKIESQVGDRIFEIEGNSEPWVPDQVDYLHDYR